MPQMEMIKTGLKKKKPNNRNKTCKILLSSFKLPVPLMEIKFIGLKEVLTIFPSDIREWYYNVRNGRLVNAN